MNTLEQYAEQFATAARGRQYHHQKQRDHVTFYNESAVYKRKAGEQKPRRTFSLNLLKMFADKNIQFTSAFPTLKVPAETPDYPGREQAALKEKILYSTLEKSLYKSLQREYAQDATIMSEAVNLLEFDQDERCPKLRRLDPRACYELRSNDEDDTLLAFFYAERMTKEQIKARYGVDQIDAPAIANPDLQEVINLDGTEKYWVVFRWDAETYCAWAGNRWIVAPHQHKLGVFPIDVARPWITSQIDRLGGFYLDPLIGPQAEFNATLAKKASIVSHRGNPVIWGKGVLQTEWENFKKSYRQDGGGFIGLKPNGEVGYLVLDEPTLIDSHLNMIFEQMKHLAGFPDAALGTVAGANTSGDALAMYMQPAAKSIDFQWVAWEQFWGSISEKILTIWENMLVDGEARMLNGYRPHGAVEPIRGTDESGQDIYTGTSYTHPGPFSVEFTNADLAGSKKVLVIKPSLTPKEDVAYKRFLMDAITNGVFPHAYGYDEMGIQDPEDIIEELKSDKEDVRLNPDLLKAAASLMGGSSGQVGAPPGPVSTPPSATPASVTGY